MLNRMLSKFYEKEVRRLIAEVNLFKKEEDLWRTAGTITNPAGNLVLHIAGGLNHHIGATLGHTGYVRDRDLEFNKKGVSKAELVALLEELIKTLTQTLNNLTDDQIQREHPIFFDEPKTTTHYVLVQLLLHLNYHLGQINYLRRMFE